MLLNDLIKPTTTWMLDRLDCLRRLFNTWVWGISYQVVIKCTVDVLYRNKRWDSTSWNNDCRTRCQRSNPACYSTWTWSDQGPQRL